VLWVRNRGVHGGCLSEVNVWVSGGSDTQNTEGTQQFILVRASEPCVQQYSDLCVRNAQSGDYDGGNRNSLVGDRSVLS
jgi:hypothetical protein